jgi:hypothetical protein
MSTATNRIKRSIAPKAIFAELNVNAGISSAVSFNQGDLLYYDATNHLVKKMSAEGDAATCLGIATVTVASGVLVGPYSGLASSASVAIQAITGPQYGDISALILKSSDALVHGAYVYADPSDGAEFVQASGTKPIGVYQGPAITGDGVKTVECLLGARFPNDTLKF